MNLDKLFGTFLELLGSEEDQRRQQRFQRQGRSGLGLPEQRRLGVDPVVRVQETRMIELREELEVLPDGFVRFILVILLSICSLKTSAFCRRLVGVFAAGLLFERQPLVPEVGLLPGHELGSPDDVLPPAADERADPQQVHEGDGGKDLLDHLVGQRFEVVLGRRHDSTGTRATSVKNFKEKILSKHYSVTDEEEPFLKLKFATDRVTR